MQTTDKNNCVSYIEYILYNNICEFCIINKICNIISIAKCFHQAHATSS